MLRREQLPSPPPSAALSSARLAALHARLSLSPQLALPILGRCLIDPTADSHPSFNNQSLSILGNDLLSYHASEQLLCTYPRLPAKILATAMDAYIGFASLSSLAKEWGLESAGAPGGEVDAGLLQYQPTIHPHADPTGTGVLAKDLESLKRRKIWPWAPGRTLLSDAYSGLIDMPTGQSKTTAIDFAERPDLLAAEPQAPPVTRIQPAMAAAGAVRAIFGAIYLHGGAAAVKAFYKAHVGSRTCDIAKLFEFRAPTRDLARLCAREGFAAPVARILSETGRLSRTPVFVVGVFSGREKLGEASGASLTEARFRAAVAALKGWYLYSPVQIRVPSDVEGGGEPWEPVMVDGGEVII